MALSRDALRRRYKHDYQRYERARANLEATVRSVLQDMAPTHGIRPVPIVESSVKEFGSFYEKACRFEHEGRVTSVDDCFKEIRDIARARIICQTVDDAQRIAWLLDEQEHVLSPVKEMEAHSPAPNTGYRAIHLNLEVDAQVGPNLLATPCELQIMTTLQYAWGLYTHSDFYKGENVPPLVATLMRELSDLLHVADRFAGHLVGEVERASLKTRS
jgi:ppGpp synthetase/RelA/SpoT-type nucleotidyltranferase